MLAQDKCSHLDRTTIWPAEREAWRLGWKKVAPQWRTNYAWWPSNADSEARSSACRSASPCFRADMLTTLCIVFTPRSRVWDQSYCLLGGLPPMVSKLHSPTYRTSNHPADLKISELAWNLTPLSCSDSDSEWNCVDFFFWENKCRVPLTVLVAHSPAAKNHMGDKLWPAPSKWDLSPRSDIHRYVY